MTRISIEPPLFIEIAPDKAGPPDTKRAASPTIQADEFDPAAIVADQALRQCETEAAALLFGAGQGLKQPENAGLNRFGDARAIVADIDGDKIALIPRFDDDMNVLTIVMLDRVRDKVAKAVDKGERAPSKGSGRELGFRASAPATPATAAKISSIIAARSMVSNLVAPSLARA